MVRRRHREERIHREKDYECADGVSEKKKGRTEWVSGTDEQILEIIIIITTM